jgi:hypothetical protein
METPFNLANSHVDQTEELSKPYLPTNAAAVDGELALIILAPGHFLLHASNPRVVRFRRLVDWLPIMHEIDKTLNVNWNSYQLDSLATFWRL